jgi:GH15 family glucan-1,4-alpha-glucosidase
MTVSDMPRLRALAQRSVAIIRANQAPSGAYLASPSFPVYRYSWLRDGAFIADAMSRAGDIGSAEAFFAWCDRVLRARAGRIQDLLARHAAGEAIGHAEFLPTRYTVEGEEVGEAWWDFQLDGYGAWLWALDAHARRHRRLVTPYLAGAELSARYAAGFWEQPSYDWWEEHPDQVHTSTLAALAAGLRGVAGWSELAAEPREAFAGAAEAIRERIVAEARRTGHLTKWLGSDAVDASLIAVATPFEIVAPEDPLMHATVAEIEATLVHGGGVHRYATDSYYGGGEWLILAGFLGWHRARTGRTQDAETELEWMAAQATADGELPEQVGHHLLVPVARDGWLGRWGPVASPLLWSHAMYLTLAIELGVVHTPPSAS